jgi:hypothetical protein
MHKLPADAGICKILNDYFMLVRDLFGRVASGTIAMSMANIKEYADSYKNELFEK